MDQARTFTEILRDWQMFYATVATACATLVGLLFVALSLNRGILTREEDAELMWIARQTFYQFLMMLLLAVLLLIPYRSQSGVGLSLLGYGVVWTLGVARAFLTRIRTRRDRSSTEGFVRGFGLSFASLLWVYAVAAIILLGHVGAFEWLVGFLILLLMSAARNAWFLLVHVRKKDTWQP